jgi:hypothetical protein
MLTTIRRLHRMLVDRLAETRWLKGRSGANARWAHYERHARARRAAEDRHARVAAAARHNAHRRRSTKVDGSSGVN